MKKCNMCYLIGENIQSSLSPKIHNWLFKAKGLDHHYHYQIYQQSIIPPDLLQKNSQLQNQIQGYSITIPFKKYFYDQQLIGKGRKIQEIKGQFAKRTGIINTLVNSKISQGDSDKFIGYNTDIWAVDRLLRPKISELCQKIQSSQIDVILLGAGATSETFCYFLQYFAHCKNVWIYNRTQSKIASLQSKYNKIANNHQRHKQTDKIYLLINTLPSNILKNSYQKVIDFLKEYKFILASDILYMDVNYRQKKSSDELAKRIYQEISSDYEIKDQNRISGLDMLIWQAIEQNRLFLQLKNQYITKKNVQHDDYKLFQMLKIELS